MLKWLEKIVGGGTQPVNLEPEPPVAVAPHAPTTRPEERPLPPPVIHLDRSSEADAELAHGILARQVMVDRAYHPVAYEFGLRAETTHRGISTAQILAGVLSKLGDTRLASGRQSWIRIKDNELSENAVRQLDRTHTVILVDLTAHESANDSGALEQARLLKADGYQLALGDWQNDERHLAWLPFCGKVEVRCSAHNPMEIAALPDKLAALSPGVSTLAAEVESWEDLEFCHRSGYQMFRGSFLTRRENWPRQPKLSPERMLLVDLLNRINLGADLAEIAEQLKQSAELSYRLLRYINSAGIGAGQSIASIQQGLMLLGRDKVFRWLTVLLFTGGQAKSLDSALLEQALIRARLMERLGEGRFDRLRLDELFVVGVFSLLDMLLRLPMSVALEPLNLPPAVTQALLGGDAGESDYAPYLKLAIACEECDRGRLKELASQLALPLPLINSLQLDALVWTRQTVEAR